MNPLRIDGHTHTPFCPHGSDRPLHEYLDRAIERGIERYCITEHVPLPPGVRDPIAPGECAMLPERLDAYLDAAEAAREAYAGRLEVRIGLEIDWLGSAQGGWHHALLAILAPVWPRLDPDATLLSVHLLDEGIVDGTPEMARALIAADAPNDAYHLLYYAALREGITASWTRHGVDMRPRRVGHLTLPSKWVKSLPLADPARIEATALDLVELVAAEGLELDVNTAGLDKPDCGEIYLPAALAERARELGVPLIPGSDAHHPDEVARHFDQAAALIGGAAQERAS